MENIFFEKQQLVAQWKSCLLAIQRRDKALQEIDSTFVAQQEQAHSMETETSAYRKEIIKEQVKKSSSKLHCGQVTSHAHFLNLNS